MPTLIPDLILQGAARTPSATALRFKGQSLEYGRLAEAMERFSSGLRTLGLARHDRVAVLLPKRFETVIAMFGAARAGGVFVPVNSLLKPEQVAYILRDCNVRVLVTSADRHAELAPALAQCPDLEHVLLVDSGGKLPATPAATFGMLTWESAVERTGGAPR